LKNNCEAIMAEEINFERVGYESRIDLLADEMSAFVEMELQTIDEDAVRASPQQWAAVCRFFAGCAAAARAQGQSPGRGGPRVAEYLASEFPCKSDGSRQGFDEFMDWLSNPAAFRPTRLRLMLQRG
jgi:hypothetical protein